MQNMATRQVARDKTLDYLFQVSVEEQFETLRASQERVSERTSLIGRLSQWFRGSLDQEEHYEDYLKEE